MKKLELTKTERKVIELIGYETRESEFLWNYETKKSDIRNPKFVEKNREAIRRAIRENEVENLQQLFTKLNNEKKEADAKEAKRRKIDKQQKSAMERVNFIILKYSENNPIVVPTKKLAAELITYDQFKSMTSFARNHFLKVFRVQALKWMWNFRTGAHMNYFEITKDAEIEIVTHVDNDWNLYSKRTKYPAHHYTFQMFIPDNYSFTKIGSLITVFKGKKIDRNGMEVVWFEQARGLEVKKVEGFLVRGFHIKRSKSVKTLQDAVDKVAKIRKKTAREIRERRFWNSLTREQISENLKQVWITTKDSVEAGNCPAGTRNFKERYEQKNKFGEIGAVRADELLQQANGEIYYVKRILAHKLGVQL
jgi:hypothetical protein